MKTFKAVLSNCETRPLRRPRLSKRGGDDIDNECLKCLNKNTIYNIR